VAGSGGSTAGSGGNAAGTGGSNAGSGGASGAGSACPDAGKLDSLGAWQTRSGNWSAANGVLTGSSDGVALITSGPSFTDTAVTMDLTVLSGATTEASIVLRYQDDKNFYWMGLGLYSHQFSIARMVNGTPTELASFGDASSNKQNQTFHVTASVAGDKLGLVVDGTEVLTTSDASLADGLFGVRTYMSSLQVDNLSCDVGSTCSPTTCDAQ
jgi:hypothetical protein